MTHAQPIRIPESPTAQEPVMCATRTKSHFRLGNRVRLHAGGYGIQYFSNSQY